MPITSLTYYAAGKDVNKYIEELETQFENAIIGVPTEPICLIDRSKYSTGHIDLLYSTAGCL